MERAAVEAEDKLIGLVSNSYAKKGRERAATTIVLERRTTGWYLTSVTATTIGQQGGGSGQLALTPVQAEHAVSVFKRQFTTLAA